MSPINGFDIPESPAPRQLDIKCFTYTEKPPSGSVLSQSKANTTNDKKGNNGNRANVYVAEDNAFADDVNEETAKIVHLIGARNYDDDEIGYCTTASSLEEA